ncbi:MAG: hypothetical protein ABEH83_13270, partial [Halobacterium sp.]
MDGTAVGEHHEGDGGVAVRFGEHERELGDVADAHATVGGVGQRVEAPRELVAEVVEDGVADDEFCRLAVGDDVLVAEADVPGVVERGEERAVPVGVGDRLVQSFQRPVRRRAVRRVGVAARDRGRRQVAVRWECGEDVRGGGDVGGLREVRLVSLQRHAAGDCRDVAVLGAFEETLGFEL